MPQENTNLSDLLKQEQSEQQILAELNNMSTKDAVACMDKQIESIVNVIDLFHEAKFEMLQSYNELQQKLQAQTKECQQLGVEVIDYKNNLPDLGQEESLPKKIEAIQTELSALRKSNQNMLAELDPQVQRKWHVLKLLQAQKQTLSAITKEIEDSMYIVDHILAEQLELLSHQSGHSFKKTATDSKARVKDLDVYLYNMNSHIDLQVNSSKAICDMLVIEIHVEALIEELKNEIERLKLDPKQEMRQRQRIKELQEHLQLTQQLRDDLQNFLKAKQQDPQQQWLFTYNSVNKSMRATLDKLKQSCLKSEHPNVVVHLMNQLILMLSSVLNKQGALAPIYQTKTQKMLAKNVDVLSHDMPRLKPFGLTTSN